jgi:hypothetical protein
MKEERGVSIWSVSGEKYAYKWTPSPEQVNKIHISHGKTSSGVFSGRVTWYCLRYNMHVAAEWLCGLCGLATDKY